MAKSKFIDQFDNLDMKQSKVDWQLCETNNCILIEYQNKFTFEKTDKPSIKIMGNLTNDEWNYNLPV